MRKKKALINIFFSIILELVTVISGLIVPRLIIGAFGSDTNGLINSITSFVGYIALLQSGVGSVVKASLYKPLANKNHDQLCVIIKTAESFFRRIALITVVYLCVLSFVFPLFITKDYDIWFTISLVFIIGISTAAQYFFGITYQMVLEADQCSYIYSFAQIISIIINTIIVVILINAGSSIQIVKFGSTIIYVLRPFILGLYTKRKYRINNNVSTDFSLLKQRWDGFLQAIAYFIHSKTDVFVLTIFASLSDVSVYSVYAYVTTGLSSFINAIDKAVRSAFGNIIASDEQDNLVKSFNTYNCLMHIFSTICFATATVSITNFIKVYVKDITDAEYIQPTFAVLIITAEFFYCLRMPYNSIIYAAGKFKETKYPAIIEALINIVVSCILVRILGIIGVAIGTLSAMIYRTISFAIYLRNDILRLSALAQIKRYSVTLIAYCISITMLSHIQVATARYTDWVIYAGVIFVLTTSITIVVNLSLDHRNTMDAVKRLLIRKKTQ